MAVVRRLATSEPPDGSVIASAEIFSPASTAGSTRRFMAALPAARMGGEPMVCDISDAHTPPAPPRASSSDRISL
jgi:hypothetical protein